MYNISIVILNSYEQYEIKTLLMVFMYTNTII